MEPTFDPAARSRTARRAWLPALLMLLTLLFGCGGGGSDPAAPAGQTPQQGTSTPEALRGQWETVLTYVPPFYAGTIGNAPPGDGSIGITFYFAADGRYQHIWDLAQAYFGGNRFRTAHWEEAGSVSGEGAVFTFNPGRAIYSVLDSCGQSRYLDPAPVAPASHTLTLERDATGWPLLRISFPNGDVLLEKCRRCQ